MKAAGLEVWWDLAELSVMGLYEIVSHLPRLFRLRRRLVERVLELRPDVFIGIDAPDFNLGVEKRLRHRSIPVIHYVSPTIWAWRAGRIGTIARSTERVLCLFPFEPRYYDQHDVEADYTGHPLADRIPMHSNSEVARVSLALDVSGPLVALLPGSRASEVEKLTSAMLEAASELSETQPGITFVIPAATDSIRNLLESKLQQYPQANCQVIGCRSIEVMTAADVVVCASGTAALEAMLVNRPMVVCYRLSNASYLIMKQFKLLKSRYISLPNILAGEALVPELIQHQVSGQRIAAEVKHWLDHSGHCGELKSQFTRIHQQLKTDAAATAATAVLGHISNAHEIEFK